MNSDPGAVPFGITFDRAGHLAVAEHKRPEGKRWISNLLALGTGLGYEVEPEYDVFSRPDREGPADVAWLGTDTDGVPLFIFEVESMASAQVEHNAGRF